MNVKGRLLSHNGTKRFHNCFGFGSSRMSSFVRHDIQNKSFFAYLTKFCRGEVNIFWILKGPIREFLSGLCAFFMILTRSIETNSYNLISMGYIFNSSYWC